MPRKILCALALATLAACPSPPRKVAPPDPKFDGKHDNERRTGASLDVLTSGSRIGGFRSVAVYTESNDKRNGARFIHEPTKFTFDYLQIESAPQAYLWVGSYATSDKGEPHTQEHLLLGKGDRGRQLGSAQAMSLVSSSA